MAPRTALTVRSERGRIVELHHVAGLPSPRTRALWRAVEKNAHARAHLVYRYQAQEPGDRGVPDIERPPDQEVPGMGKEDVPAAPDGSGAPPFTGEDAEDVGPNPRNPHRPM